jgi:tripartite-type tricarboxylate transporter receptor subunit TctC
MFEHRRPSPSRLEKNGRRMMMKQLRTLWLGLAAATAACMGVLTQAPPAVAQSYPNQTVRIIVPFSAGSITDGLARILAEKLSDAWKQQVIVENRPGLAGTTSVAKSTGDGYTLMLTSNGHTIAGTINKNIQFDPVKDFAGITRVASVPLAAIVPPDLPVKTLKDFIALANEKPGQLNFSSAGLASTSYLSGEIFKQGAKINIVHVPYRGAPEAVTAVVRGDAQIYFAPIPSAQELGATNKVKVLAVNSDKRIPQLPDVPTVAEAAVPDYKYESWFAVMAPAGTPREIIRKVNQDIAKVLQMQDVTEKMVKQGSIPAPTSPEQLDGMIKSETERYGQILRAAGVAAN